MELSGVMMSNGGMFEDDLDGPLSALGKKSLHRIAPAVHREPVSDELAHGQALFRDESSSDIEGGIRSFFKNVTVNACHLKFLMP